MNEPNKVKIMLDWHLSPIHSGFFISKELGYYQKEGLQVEIIVPNGNELLKIPDRLNSREFDFAVISPESLIDARLRDANIRAVAALLGPSSSALLVKKNSDLHRPSQLKDKVYGSHGYPLEDEIIKELIRSDGVEPEIQVKKKEDQYQIFDEFLNDQFDFIWGFIPWETDLAKSKNVSLREIPLLPQIPYVNSPIIATHVQMEQENPEIIRRFLRSTQLGYQWATQDANNASEILMKSSHGSSLKKEILPQSHRNISSLYFEAKGKKNWGFLNPQLWDDYISFLFESRIIDRNYPNSSLDRLQSAKDITTNEYLSAPPGSAY